MRVSNQKDNLKPIDITIREIEEVEQARENFPSRKLKVNYSYPELAEKVIHYRKPENFEDYCSHLRIRTKKRGLIPFKFKRAQKVFWHLYVKKSLDNNEAVRQYVLKARQIGFSTLIEAIMFWGTSLFGNNFGHITAHDKTKSSQIFEMTKLFYKTSPSDMQPTRKLSNRHEIYFANPNEEGELGLESKIIVDTADNVHIGASSTIQFAHLSEFARYEAVNKEIRLALVTLFQAIPDLPNTMAFIETTAYGSGLGKEYWDDEDNGYGKLFVSWLADDEYRENYSVPEKELRISPEDKFGDETTLRISVIDQLRQWYPEYADDNSWYDTESLHRLAWRRKVINEQSLGNKDYFRQEYPTTPDEAFLSTGSSIFDKQKLSAYQIYAKEIEKNKLYQRYTYIRPKYENDFKDVGCFRPSDFGELYIYEHPKKDERYVIGADVGYGVEKGDESAFHVLNERGDQVAVFHCVISPEDFAYPLIATAHYYNKAFINPEANAPGVALIVRIKDRRYFRMYQRESFSSAKHTISTDFGFHTNARTKPIVISLLREAVKDGTILLRHPETIRQLMVYAYDKDGKLSAPSGDHDDLVIALALAIKILPDEKELINTSRGTRYGTLDWWVKLMEETNSDSGMNLGNVMGI